MGSVSNPDLSVVREEAPRASESESGAAETEPLASPRRFGAGPALVGGLVLLAVGAGLFAAHQYRRAESLSTINGALEAELGEVQGQLGAYRTHLATVRLSVTGLSEGVQQLQSLVNREPAAPTGARAKSEQVTD